MKKRFILLILIICLTLCSCEAEIFTNDILGAYSDTDSEPENQKTVMEDITLLYYPDMDTHPLTTNVYANHELLKLVYSPLIRVDSQFQPYCVLAQNYTQNKNTVTVTLRDGLVFSDGTVVTAQDVVNSFKTVLKTPESPYYTQVSAFSRFYAKDKHTFICETHTADIDAAILLDVPVLKGGTELIGCGPYLFSEREGKSVLVINENYYKRSTVPVIYLVDTKTDTHISSLFSAGELDIIAVAGNDDLSLTNLRDYSIVTYPSNNMIYIGINHTNELLSKAEVRCAISDMIDRNKTASQELVGLADGTVYPFNPSWYRMDGIPSVPDYSEEKAKKSAELLKDSELKLIIPQGSDIKTTVAQSIVQNFKTAGVTLTVTELSPEEYKSAVQTGAYDLYLGETAVSRSMDASYLYKTGGSMNYTGYTNTELDSLFTQYKAGKILMNEYIETFKAEMPIIPILFRKNVLYVASGIKNFAAQSAWNSFGDITTVTLNN